MIVIQFPFSEGYARANPLISVIVPIYNTASYLKDSIESIITQSIGFDRIQLILVNDGSTDSSEEICAHYSRLYPNNVEYLFQQHSGVSQARNLGLRQIKGKYVAFLDSDDKWDPHAFYYLSTFFEQHYNEVDFIASRMMCFGKKNGPNIHDYMFNSTRIVSLLAYPNCIPGYVTSAIFKTEAIRSRRFSTYLRYYEDAQFVASLLLKRLRIGFVREALYYYRHRDDGSSIVQSPLDYRRHFFNTPIFFHQALFNESIALYGIVHRFVQFIVMFDIQWRVRDTRQYNLSQSDRQVALDLLTASLKMIEDDIILDSRYLSKKQIMAVLCRKYGVDLGEIIFLNHGVLWYKQTPYVDFKDSREVLDAIKISVDNSSLFILFDDLLFFSRKLFTYYLRVSNRNYNPTYLNTERLTFRTCYGIEQEGRQVLFQIPLKRIHSPEFQLFIVIQRTEIRIPFNHSLDTIISIHYKSNGKKYPLLIVLVLIAILIWNRYLRRRKPNWRFTSHLVPQYYFQ